MLRDDSHEMSSLIFSETDKTNFKVSSASNLLSGPLRLTWLNL